MLYAWPVSVRRPVIVFLHSGDYDRLHQGAAIAATAAAAGREVEIFFFWWALRALAAGDLARPEIGGRLGSPEEEALLLRFEARSFPTAAELLAAARETGLCRLFACSASAELLGLRSDALEGKIDQLLGWAGILARTEGNPDRFYL